MFVLHFAKSTTCSNVRIALEAYFKRFHFVAGPLLQHSTVNKHTVNARISAQLPISAPSHPPRERTKYGAEYIHCTFNERDLTVLIKSGIGFISSWKIYPCDFTIVHRRFDCSERRIHRLIFTLTRCFF